jgi:hypothetical protein
MLEITGSNLMWEILGTGACARVLRGDLSRTLRVSSSNSFSALTFLCNLFKKCTCQSNVMNHSQKG